MKISIAIALLIAVAASLFGWQQHQRLADLKHGLSKAKKTMNELGISPGMTREEMLAKSSERAARSSGIDTAAKANELIAFIKKMKKLEESGEMEDNPDIQREAMVFMASFSNLTPTELLEVMSLLKASDEIDSQTQKEVSGFLLMMVASNNPESALTLMTSEEHNDLMDNGGMGDHLLQMALSSWATKEPDRAMAWLQENQKDHPELQNGQLLSQLSVAMHKDRLSAALKTAQDLGVGQDDLNQIFWQVARNVKTNEQRDDYLATIRANPDLEDKLGNLFGNLAGSGFENATQWMEKSKLTEKELVQMGSQLNYHTTKDDSGKWLQWISANEQIGTDTRDRGVEALMSSWTRGDYKAAGKWLNASEEGPLRTQAIAVYAETVAPYDKEAARIWAAQMPDGEKKTKLLESLGSE